MQKAQPQILEYLFGLRRFGWKLDLDRISALLNRLGNPERRFESVHIAGTNGKGSTAAMLASILVRAGIKTGLFTSPHLIVPEERIVVDGRPIERLELLDLASGLKEDIDQLGCTFFEAMTAISFLYFAEQGIEIAVVETGLGGRFDATNVLQPILTLITDIGLDHTQHLGQTLDAIAREKAGILKLGVPCLTSACDSLVVAVLREEARRRAVELQEVSLPVSADDVRLTETGTWFRLGIDGRYYDGLHTALIGAHQVRNAALAVAAAEKLAQRYETIDEAAIRTGLESVSWPGRLQKLGEGPIVVVDVAHNPDALRSVVDSLSQVFRYRRLIGVMGVMADKDYRSMVKILGRAVDEAVAVAPAMVRALPAETLRGEFESIGVRCTNGGDPFAGLGLAQDKATREDLIFCTGSHYTVGEILEAKDSQKA